MKLTNQQIDKLINRISYNVYKTINEEFGEPFYNNKIFSNNVKNIVTKILNIYNKLNIKYYNSNLCINDYNGTKYIPVYEN